MKHTKKSAQVSRVAKSKQNEVLFENQKVSVTNDAKASAVPPKAKTSSGVSPKVGMTLTEFKAKGKQLLEADEQMFAKAKSPNPGDDPEDPRGVALFPGDDPVETPNNLMFAERVGDCIAPTKCMFVRGDEVVCASRQQEAGAAPMYQFLELTVKAACTELERHVKFAEKRMVGGDQGKPKIVFQEVPLTPSLVPIILNSHGFKNRMHRLKAVAPYPQPIRKGGRISPSVPKYDPETQVFTQPLDGEIPDMSVKEAVDFLLEDVLGDFCFERPDENPHLYASSAVALLLTSYARLLVLPERTPLFFAEGNRPGVGKDELLKLVITVDSGSIKVPGMAPTENPEEMRKRLLAVLRSGDSRFFYVSNYKGHLGDEVLEHALTAPMYKERLLGSSVDLTVPNDVIYMYSGNGCAYSADMARRMQRIKLVYNEEDLNARRFRHPELGSWALENRRRILGALQSLVKAWVNAGCPNGRFDLPSFVTWSRLIGGIIENAARVYGRNAPLVNPIAQDRSLGEDPDSEVADFRTLLGEMQNRLDTRSEWDAAGIRDLAVELELFGDMGNLATDPSAQKRLGHHLRGYHDRIFGDAQFIVIKGARTKYKCRRLR